MSDDAFDLGAEQSLLGSVLAAPEVAGPYLLAIPPSAWWRPRHASIAAVLAKRLRASRPVDPQTVLPDLLRLHGFGPETGPELITLMQRAWAPANADAYADRILACAARRNLAGAATRLRQQLNTDWINGDLEPLSRVAAEMRAACDEAEALDAGAGAIEPSMPLDDLLSMPDTHDWLVPGLLERGERIILTGSEGLGKSWMISQFGACLAAGLHPFTGSKLGSRAPQLQVLVVDCENGMSQSRRRFDKIVRRLGAEASTACRKNLRIELRPNGLDLLGQDASWLERKVAANSPDLLIVGPIYRLHYANVNDETAARELVRVLDNIRTRYGCALLTEAHAGHAEDNSGERRMRPAGSSLFLRWPEFGYGLRRAKGAEGEHPNLVDVVAWRGSREERQWPRQLCHGDFLPWEPADQTYYEEAA